MPSGILLCISDAKGASALLTKKSLERYLETIYHLSKTADVHAALIARTLSCSRVTVCRAMKQLVENHYVSVNQYRKIELTTAGRKIARDVIRRRKVLCQVLIALGVSEEVAREDAQILAHDIGAESYKALKAYLTQLK